MKNDNHFDIIIANPPYGKIGNEITKTIIDNLTWDEYINLLPANDYRRNKQNKLWQYVDLDNMESIRDGFSDAKVTTHLTKIFKKPKLYISETEFEVENYIDDSLKKYFYENSKRNHYAIDIAPVTGFGISRNAAWDINKTFIFAFRDMNHTFMGGKDSVTYKWNIEKSVDYNYIRDTCVTKNGQLLISNINFNTKEERDNFTNFIYENDEVYSKGLKGKADKNSASGFINKLFRALNVDGGIQTIALPKVDWTRSWTPEEILNDYGYSDEEIAEVFK